MTKTELIENLCDYFGLEMPEKNEKGKYYLDSYYWRAGCHFKDGVWLTLRDVVCALWDSCENDDD